MYKFRKLKGLYGINVSTVYSGAIVQAYSAVMELVASYRDAENDFVFELSSRKDVRLNGCAPSNMVDLFMLRLSDTYYPIKLGVSTSGEILRVLNFYEIRERWKTECDKIIKGNPYVVYEQYIDVSRSNLDTEISFLQALRKDSFIQFYFMKDAGNSQVVCYNFPKCVENTFYELTLDDNLWGDKDTKAFCAKVGDDGRHSGRVTSRHSEQGDMLFLDSEFRFNATSGQSVKKIGISVKDRTVNVNKLMSFLLD